MDLKAFRHQILYGSIARRLLLRTFAIASAISIIPLLHIYSNGNSVIFDPIGSYDCASSLSGSPENRLSQILVPLWGSAEPAECSEYINLTKAVVMELTEKKLLNYSGKTLCAGGNSGGCLAALRELGFSEASGVNRHPFFSLKQKRVVYDLDYADSSFDFVLSRDIDRVSVPALLVLEIERVLKPGGIGAVLVGTSGSDPIGLIRSATPISSLLKASSIIHVGFMNDFTLVVFKKNSRSIGFLEQFTLPDDCPSIINNRPVIDLIEPLVQEKENAVDDPERKYAYLPNLIDISSRKRMVYIDIGAGEHINSTRSNWFLPSYPVDTKAFNVYFVDHNTSVLLSYVMKPGVTFVYHPGLAGHSEAHSPSSDDGDFDPFPGYEGFDFLEWFKETVRYSDFVVLKMNSGEPELKFLGELFESGAICFVDELFLHCSDPRKGTIAIEGDCTDLLQGLRSIGVFAHQW